MIRVLLAKPGIDGHDVGVKIVARALRDAGMEVIYTGLRTTITDVARTAIQEDVDAIGISNLSSQNVTMIAELQRLLRELGGEDILLTTGGSLLPEDVAALAELGIEGAFPPGTASEDIITYIRENIRPRENALS